MNFRPKMHDFVAYLTIVDLGLSQHCREDNRILETMIVATIVTIVATIKKIAKLLILKAKFKEINHII